MIEGKKSDKIKAFFRYCTILALYIYYDFITLIYVYKSLS